MKSIILVVLLVASCSAESRGRKLWHASLAALVAGSAADAASSYGKYESNPLLGPAFNRRSVTIKAAFLGSSVCTQLLFVKHWKKYGPATTVNFVAAVA